MSNGDMKPRIHTDGVIVAHVYIGCISKSVKMHPISSENFDTLLGPNSLLPMIVAVFTRIGSAWR